MDISALYIKHLPVSNQYVICTLQNGEVTTSKNFNTLDAAVKEIEKLAKKHPDLFKFPFENLYVMKDKVEEVFTEGKEVKVTCDGKNFTASYFHSENNARHYAKLLRQVLLQNRKQ